jgi:hypothetical protein
MRLLLRWAAEEEEEEEEGLERPRRETRILLLQHLDWP